MTESTDADCSVTEYAAFPDRGRHGRSFRPVSLRNLSPDQTLVLVDGSRRHRSALVNLQFSPLGTVNTGAQAVDFSP